MLNSPRKQSLTHHIKQESPTPRPQTSTGLWPFRNWLTQQEVSKMQEGEASFVFKTTHITHVTALLQFNNNRNKLHNKLSVRELSGNHSPSYLWKYFLPWNQSLVPKRLVVAQMVKRLPTMQETWVQSPGQEDPLEKEMATHSSILAWRIPRTEEPCGLQSIGSQRVRHDWATSLHFTSIERSEIVVGNRNKDKCNKTARDSTN